MNELIIPFNPYSIDWRDLQKKSAIEKSMADQILSINAMY
jgi:hypothetical protein